MSDESLRHDLQTIRDLSLKLVLSSDDASKLQEAVEKVNAASGEGHLPPALSDDPSLVFAFMRAKQISQSRTKSEVQVASPLYRFVDSPGLLIGRLLLFAFSSLLVVALICYVFFPPKPREPGLDNSPPKPREAGLNEDPVGFTVDIDRRKQMLLYGDHRVSRDWRRQRGHILNSISLNAQGDADLQRARDDFRRLNESLGLPSSVSSRNICTG